MNMIWHDDISADGDSAWQTCFAKIDELFMHPAIGQKFSPMISIERDEVQRGIVFLKNELQSWGTIGHAKNMWL
jgi:hypothetical protein